MVEESIYKPMSVSLRLLWFIFSRLMHDSSQDGRVLAKRVRDVADYSR